MSDLMMEWMRGHLEVTEVTGKDEESALPWKR